MSCGAGLSHLWYPIDCAHYATPPRVPCALPEGGNHIAGACAQEGNLTRALLPHPERARRDRHMTEPAPQRVGDGQKSALTRSGDGNMGEQARRRAWVGKSKAAHVAAKRERKAPPQPSRGCPHIRSRPQRDGERRYVRGCARKKKALKLAWVVVITGVGRFCNFDPRDT